MKMLMKALVLDVSSIPRADTPRKLGTICAAKIGSFKRCYQENWSGFKIK